MRLVIELPDGRPTLTDYAAIDSAVEALKVGMRLRKSPRWMCVIVDRNAVTTSAAATMAGVHRTHWATIAKRHGVEPARVDKIGTGRKTVAYWALDDVERIRTERKKNPPKRGPKT